MVSNLIQFKETEPEHWINILGTTPIFLFPARIVGGHELMALEIISKMLELGCRITILAEPSNSRLIDIITDSFQKKDINLLLLPIKQPRFEFLHAIFNIVSMNKIVKYMRSIFSDLPYSNIIIVQGDIEIGSMYIIAANRIKIPFISYLPFTHSAKTMGKPLATIRDFFAKSIYKSIRHFCTISTIFETELKKLSPECRVDLLRNDVRDLRKYEVLREIYVATKSVVDKLDIYIIGRISFRQKGHDRLIKAISLLSTTEIDNIKLNVIGDGEDTIKFQKLCRQMCPTLEVEMHGLMREPWEKAYAADLLLVPSRFEGVPLVMLEGLKLGVTVLGSNCDGMIEYLDADLRFNDELEMADLIKSYLYISKKHFL